MPSKTCSACRITKDLEEFPRMPSSSDGRHTYCKPCKAAKARGYRANDLDKFSETQRAWRQGNLKNVMLIEARKRAKKTGIDCTITRDDFDVPEFCPILGIPITPGNGHPVPGSPSLDRIDIRFGYVPGNVQVISYKANTMKNNATREELLMFAEWVRKNLGGESDA